MLNDEDLSLTAFTRSFKSGCILSGDVDDISLLTLSCPCRPHCAEGDRRAYYETSQWTMQQNRETVVNLKAENRELKKALSAANSKRDGKVVSNGRERERARSQARDLRA